MRAYSNRCGMDRQSPGIQRCVGHKRVHTVWRRRRAPGPQLVAVATAVAMAIAAVVAFVGPRAGVPSAPASGPPVAMVAPEGLAAGAGLPTPMILGYYDGGGVGSAGFADLVAERARLTGIVPDWYEIWSQGQVTGTPDPGVMAYARAQGLWTFALVQQNADPAVFRTLLGVPANARRGEENLLRIVEQGGFDGVNLDFEGIAASDRTAFTRFVQALAALFHAHGYYVTLSVPAETSDQPGNAWTGAYDYRDLGRAADLVMPMAYDDHYAGGPAGPVAPTGWVAAVARFAARAIGPSKVVLGLPGYGYDWGGASVAAPLSFGQAVALDNAFARGRAGSHFAYDTGGVVHQVYFDDAQSFEAQSQVAVEFDLRGIVLWRLGIEDPQIWQLLIQ